MGLLDGCLVGGAPIANYRGIRRTDADAIRLAQRWSKYMAVTFAVGAVTGTVLSFEFGLPCLSSWDWGEAFGAPFAFEGLFLLLEAVSSRSTFSVGGDSSPGPTSGSVSRSPSPASSAAFRWWPRQCVDELP
ncbi:cytochrome ubiquinol oxidase subunit I [Arthrobacter sp. NPDC058192]|uniref:cytochrome ubiquinol oxidase subunit I n=1 Tax=Arthrobacter sp. NPDC058192 TaxID=3346372 RepID=UPI0036E0C8F4